MLINIDTDLINSIEVTVFEEEVRGYLVPTGINKIEISINYTAFSYEEVNRLHKLFPNMKLHYEES